jgi:hypothetical protein
MCGYFIEWEISNNNINDVKNNYFACRLKKKQYNYKDLFVQ